MIELSRRAAAFALGLLAQSTSGIARAEPPLAPPTEEQIDIARRLYKEARELYRQGRLKDALDKSFEAYRVASTPVTALEAGELLVEAGKFVAARDILRSVAIIPVSPRESEKGREARQQAMALATALDPRIPKIAFAEWPRGAEVWLDGRVLPAADPSAWQGIDPGAHSIAIRVEERTCTIINVTLAESEVRTIDLHDAAASCRPEPVSHEAEQAPETRAAVSSPTGHRGQDAAPVAPRSEADRTRTVWHILGAGAAGVGVAAVGIGGFLGLSAKSDYDSVACAPAGCTQHAFDVRNDARSKGDAATRVMGIGAAGAVAGLLLWWLAPGAGTTTASAPARARVSLGLRAASLEVPFD
jgi:hypothetical protein